jgi:GrpB-like predicted nucleotidyltransferase (UPF0157 family)
MYLIEIVDYDPKYLVAFESERLVLVEALGQYLVDVHHFGSTAVPGLAGKDRVDILVECISAEPGPEVERAIERLGYTLSPNTKKLRHYAWNREGSPAYALHWQLAGSPGVAPVLRLRDLLRSDADPRARSAAVQREAAHLYPWDSWAYTEAKTAVIGAALEASADHFT